MLNFLKNNMFTISFNVILISIVIYAAEIYLAYQIFDREFGSGSVKPGVTVQLPDDVNYEFPSKHFPNETYVLAELEKRGIDARTRMSPSSLVASDGFTVNGQHLFPFSGFGKTTTVFCDESGFWVIYESDRFGFRNEDHLWNSDEIDYVYIGDSFTHGACVEEHDTFSGVANSTGKQVLNLGIGGTGPLVHLAVFKEYILSLIHI